MPYIGHICIITFIYGMIFFIYIWHFLWYMFQFFLYVLQKHMYDIILPLIYGLPLHIREKEFIYDFWKFMYGRVFLMPWKTEHIWFIWKAFSYTTHICFGILHMFGVFCHTGIWIRIVHIWWFFWSHLWSSTVVIYALKNPYMDILLIYELKSYDVFFPEFIYGQGTVIYALKNSYMDILVIYELKSYIYVFFWSHIWSKVLSYMF